MREAVCSILFNPDKTEVLLIKRRDIPVWVLPGGGIDQGESPDAAAAREAVEETGFQVEIARKIAYYQPANRITRPTHFYECKILGGEASTGDETKEIQFFPLQDLPKTLVPFYKTWIDDALQNSAQILNKKIEKTSYWTFLHYLICHPILVTRFLLTRVGIHINR